MAHARAIINIEDPVVQLFIYKEILKNDLSVRAVEQLARNNAPRKKSC
jgi:ParB family chromosome partitioning protein